MSLTKFGFVSWAGAAVVILFQGVSGLMKDTAGWATITAGSITGEFLDPYIEKISYESIANFVDFVVNTMELSLLLVVIGLICMIIGAFKKV